MSSEPSVAPRPLPCAVAYITAFGSLLWPKPMACPISCVATSARFAEMPRKHWKLRLNTTSPSKICMNDWPPMMRDEPPALVTPPRASVPLQLTGSLIWSSGSLKDKAETPSRWKPKAEVEPVFCKVSDVVCTAVQAAKAWLISVTPPEAVGAPDEFTWKVTGWFESGWNQR